MLKYDITPVKNKNALKQEGNLEILVVITSLQSSSFEYANSLQALSILEGLNLKYSCKDINQEMVLSYQDKVKSGIRQKFRDDGMLYLINGKMTLPQIHLGDHLILNFLQFKALQESNLLLSIVKKHNCHHVRFYKDSLEYIKTPEDSESCIYCFSEKRVNVKFIFLLNKRDSHDEEVHIVSSICEQNRISLRIFDSQNLEAEARHLDIPQAFLGKSCMMFKFNNTVYYGLDSFAEIVENKMLQLKNNITNKCEICEELLDPCLYDIRKCLTCIYVYSSGKATVNSSKNNDIEIKDDDISSIKNNQSSQVFSDVLHRRSQFISIYHTDNKENLRPLNFIEKLELKKVNHVRKLDFNEKFGEYGGLRASLINSKSDSKDAKMYQLKNPKICFSPYLLNADSFIKQKHTDMFENEPLCILGKQKNPLFQSFGNKQLD